MAMPETKSYRATKSIANRIADYRIAAAKAVDFQISYMRPDGCYIWDGYVHDAFHKQALSWSMTGRLAEAHRILDWIAANKLGADGRLEGYQGDVYKHAWFFQGALRLGRFEIADKVYKFLKSMQQPCGGSPHFEANRDKVLRALGTAWGGVGALYYNDRVMAVKAADWCLKVIEQQPRPDRFYFTTDASGKLLCGENDENIDSTKLKQCYWEAGFMMILFAKLHMLTGDRKYLAATKKLLDFHLICREDNFAFWGSGKSALGAAHYYAITGDEQALECALRFCDFVCDTQRPNGGFFYEDEPDEILIYVDHAACFSVWGTESINIAAGRLHRENRI